MSWHNRDCGIPDLDWTDGYPSCIRCNSSASSIANGAMETPPPPAPPPSLKRSQLRCSWPPCVKYFEHIADEAGNDLTEYIIENIDGWNIDATDLPDDWAKLQEVRGASQSTDGSSETPKLSSAYSNTTYTEPSDGPTETAYDNTHTVALGPTSMQSSDRIHQHLSGSYDFRVLRLYGSASSDDPLHCSLEVAQLGDPDVPLYDALSYTWADLDGNKQNCMPIYIGSHFDVLFVTKNCESALRRLRKSTDRLLWIDAICINQNDSRERSKQVNHMAKIYSIASRVLIYLGEDSNGPTEALTMATTCAKGSAIWKDVTFFVELAKRPYFKRLWIIQEIALATRASVICGDLMMHWTDLCSAFESCGAAPGWTKHFSAPLRRRRQAPSVFELLRDTKQALCIDPRDKLFGIIGLASTAERKLLPADYSILAQQLCIGLTAYLLQKPEKENILNLACNQRKIIPGLPSWVPDWTSIEYQESGAIIPELFIRSPYVTFPPLFWRQVAEKRLRSSPIDVSARNMFFNSPKMDLLMSPPLVQSTAGALLIHAVPLFKIPRGELKCHGVASRMRVTKWHMHHDSKLFSHTSELEIFAIPSCPGTAILRKHGTGVYSLQGFVHVILDHLKNTVPLESISRQIHFNILMHETRNIERWLIVVLGLHLSLSFESQDRVGGESNQEPGIFRDLCHLRGVEELLRERYERSDQTALSSSHFEAMELMRTTMVNSINPEDLAWRHPDPSDYGCLETHIMSSEAVESFAEELPDRQKSVEEQISTWSSSVAQLRLQLQEQGSFSDAFRDLQGHHLFDPIYIFSRPVRDKVMKLLPEVLGLYDALEESDLRFVHLSQILQGVYSIMSRATLDEGLPWEYNRDRFWMCMVSFDLLVRLRLLLTDRQFYATMEHSINSSIADLKRIVIV